MSPPRESRTQDCDENAARARLRDARAQLDLAEIATAGSAPEERKAAASCAVLAGIAAADAACCRSLGRRSRSQDHHEAVALVRQVAPGGPEAAKQLPGRPGRCSSALFRDSAYASYATQKRPRKRFGATDLASGAKKNPV